MQLSNVKYVEIEAEPNPFAIQLDKPMSEQAPMFLPFKLIDGVTDGRGYWYHG